MKRIIFCFPLFIMLIALSACERDFESPEENITIDRNIYTVNLWINDIMREVYLWNEEIPDGLNPAVEPDPMAFFKKYLYTEDRFSWMVDDYASLIGDFHGVAEAMGYSALFGAFSNTDGVFILVEYVFPGSPSNRAGLKRGDIILLIDGVELNMTNLEDLLSRKSYTVTLGEYSDNSIILTSNTLSMTKEIVYKDPAIYHEIKEIDDHKIGYLVYVEYTSGEFHEYLASLAGIFQQFDSAGITDMILDLRYNPGGDVTAAGFMSSSLAPASAVTGKEVLIRKDWNALYDNYFLQQEGPNSPNLVYRFTDSYYPAVPGFTNLDLNRVYVLTTRGTASACEFTIIGLEPYMDVVLIGDTTYGKYTGAWIIPDLQDPPRHNYGLVPIVFRYANSQGFTDFNDGLLPDYYVEDELLPPRQFGDLGDPVFGKALSLITGQVQQPEKSSFQYPRFRRIENPAKSRRRNLFINNPERIR